MSLRQIAKRKYLEFSKYKGSQHIAGEFAIYKMLELIEKNNVNAILEVGLGIGTLPSTIIEYKKGDIEYVGTEANEFCLNSLSENLPEAIYSKLKIYDSLSAALSKTSIFDLIIIDGTFDDFKNVGKHICSHAIIVIEGDRADQQKIINEYFPKSKYVHLISSEKNDPNGVFDSNSWEGGIKVFFINPTIQQSIFWLKGKIKTKLLYKRRLKNR